MAWTLWRGDDLLGTLHERSVPLLEARQGARHVNAVLVAVPARLPLPSVRQHVMEWAGSRTVTEHVQEPDVAGRRRPEAHPSGLAVGVWAVEPGSASQPPGVPPDRQLRVRDGAGRVVPTRYVGLLEHRPDPAHLPPELATFPEGALVRGSVWLVSFTEDPARSAT
jgi:hypothetical protein